MGSRIGNRSRNPLNKKLILTPGDANSGVERSAVGRSKVGVPKFYCVGDDEGFCVSIDNLEATVVGESGANV
jgi:hypothetical protein